MISNTLAQFNIFSGALKSLPIKLSPRFMTYNPSFDILIETKKYVLKTADTTDELAHVFRLRHQNFLEDIAQDQEIFDVDEFDHICDHLIITCKETNEIIGTYRIMCSLYTDKFYSQNEFELDEFLSLDDVKLELGRACIDAHHRNGNVIDLLWKGIARYSQLTGARYLFGCSSVKTVEAQTAMNVMSYLKEKDKYSTEFNIKATSPFAMDFSHCIDQAVFDVKSLIPPLLLSYLTAGALVYGEPALDKEFECVDFMTILDLSELSPLFRRRYFR